jgi:hypothetical protein
MKEIERIAQFLPSKINSGFLSLHTSYVQSQSCAMILKQA